MSRPNVLVIAVDGLRASDLGAYGNTTFSTPTLDRFAAQSVLCDSFFADSIDLSSIYRGLWQATSALRPRPLAEPEASLPTKLSKAGYETRLITDCHEITKLIAVQQFSEAVFVDHASSSQAIEIEQTAAASVLSELVECMASNAGITQQPLFLWTHLRFAFGPWDAPHEIAMSLIEDGDVAPEPSVVPPDRVVGRTTQADEIYSEHCRYAAQVIAFDSLLAPLCDLLDRGQAGNCACVLLGTRGFPLGEHGRLGGVDGRLYSEQLHAPLLLRLPEGQGALSRLPSLVHPADLPATILRLLNVEDIAGDGRDFLQLMDQPNASWRTRLLASGTNRALSIRTPSWYLQIAHGNQGEETKLFVKPDDRWEMNDVAGLCAEVAVDLKDFALAERTRIEAGGAFETESLPDHLLESML